MNTVEESSIPIRAPSIRFLIVDSITDIILLLWVLIRGVSWSWFWRCQQLELF